MGCSDVRSGIALAFNVDSNFSHFSYNGGWEKFGDTWLWVIVGFDIDDSWFISEREWWSSRFIDEVLKLGDRYRSWCVDCFEFDMFLIVWVWRFHTMDVWIGWWWFWW